MRFFLAFGLFLSIFSRLDRHFFKQNDSFCPKFILPKWKRCPQLPTPYVEIDPLIQQPFSYLTKGKQSFVFLSEDGKWVLKCLRLPRYSRYFSKPGHSSSLKSLTKTLEGARSAQTDLKEETQVIYAHLHPTSHFKNSITLIDKFKRSYYLELDTLPFVLQRYGEDFFTQFDLSEKKEELITEVFALFNECYAKGFIDRDPILDKNFGIIDGHPFIIDVGQLEKPTLLPAKRCYLEMMTISLKSKLEGGPSDLYHFYQKNLN